MEYKRKNEGVCSWQTAVKLEDGRIEDIEIAGGCDGNLKGIRQLLLGRTAEEVIPLLEGIQCGSRGTSCPAQIALCLREALAKGEG